MSESSRSLADRPTPDTGTAATDGTQPPESPSAILRRAADLVDNPEVITPDRRWLDVIPNRTADHLAAWLREEAGDAQMVDDLNTRAAERAVYLGDDDGQTYCGYRTTLVHALGLARDVLGEAT